PRLYSQVLQVNELLFVLLLLLLVLLLLLLLLKRRHKDTKCHVCYMLCMAKCNAIAGEIGMDTILDNIGNSLFNGLLPAYWKGARWDMDKMELGRSHPKILVEDLPILSVIPIEAHRVKLQNTYRSPVYTTSLRRNAMGIGLVFEADLATTEDLSHWVLQGVCLTLNRD
uniref:Dynein heavy chain C-terminal domain-containing protein n=1 Tax=Glossina palpalis gambiensis TaxID=67801 RepID=A0A1B0C4S1_9MUSC